MTEVNSLSIIDQSDITTFKSDMKKIAQWQNLVQTNLTEGKDYGTIPGTKKPTLYKAGAEKIVVLGKLRSTFDVLDRTKDFENEFFQFEIRWNLWIGDNIIVQGVGLCSSKEDKYRYRWLPEKKLPASVKKENLPCKELNGKYGKYKVYRVENDDICSIANTIEKMAKKRALVDAALLVGSLSELFTQDVEDLPEEYLGNNKPIQKPKSGLKPLSPEDEKKHKEAEIINLATQPQKDKIYGTVICEKCGTRVYGFKCPKCKNADNIHIATKGFIHSHLLTKDDFKNDMKPILLPDKLTKIEAMIIWDWWIGDSKNMITGERLKRESKNREEQAKPDLKETKADKIKQARGIVKAPGKLEVKDEDKPFPDEEGYIAPEGMPD